MHSISDDTTPLYSSLAGDPDLHELVVMFVDEMPDRVFDFQAAVDSGDVESLQRFAHQLKGSAGSYGFDQLTPLAAAVEFSAAENEPEEQLRNTLVQLVSACQRVTADRPH